MIPSNNLSVLPWYDSIERQNSRKWWTYGAVYPLFCPGGYILPWQIMRKRREERGKGELLEFSTGGVGYLTRDGSWYQDAEAGYVSEYIIASTDTTIYLENLAHELQSGEHGADAVSYVIYNGSGVVLATGRSVADTESIFVDLPQGAAKIRMQARNDDVAPDITGHAYSVADVSVGIKTCMLYDREGNLLKDIVVEMTEAGMTIKSFEEFDVIVFPSIVPVLPGLSNGQYYLEMSDGIETWYSEIFTVVNDISGYLKLEWWDVEDFEMDGGVIVYQNPGFKNVVYLQADIAKPEYLFEEEGETRDGYFFPQKQISEKRYHFSFLASEYLLDVLRFVRMADYAYITKDGQRYSLDTFLISPEWEDYGDVARVEAEFDTATVAKKVGKGYIERVQGDFNSDYNNDFSKE